MQKLLALRENETLTLVILAVFLLDVITVAVVMFLAK